MGGGLIQLAAYGAQDIYLTGNPQITFFQMVYRRHTNYSKESIEQTFIGSTDFGKRLDIHLTRNGDLLHRVYLEHSVSVERKESGDEDNPHNIGIVEHYGHSLIKECDVVIGGQKIDRHSSLWQRIRGDLMEENPDGHITTTLSGATLSLPEFNGTTYQYMTGNSMGANTANYNSDDNYLGVPNGKTYNGFTYTNSDGKFSDIKARINVNKIFIPLQFWFCRHHGLALPLVALQYHNVELILKIEEFSNLFRTSDEDSFIKSKKAEINNLIVNSYFRLWADYIYLDTDERRRFAQEEHEYLIEQIQEEKFNCNLPNNNYELKFNHPVKEFIWVIQNNTQSHNDTLNAPGGRNQPLSDLNGDWSASPVSIDDFKGKWLIKFNNHERFKERDTEYFTRVQVKQHHTGYGSVKTRIATKSDLSGGSHELSKSNSIAVYSFALNPEDHQPSGVCNTSRIDNVVLESINLRVWAIGNTQSGKGDYVLVGEPGAINLKITVFAVNYNILRIMSGMGGLAYSN